MTKQTQGIDIATAIAIDSDENESIDDNFAMVMASTDGDGDGDGFVDGDDQFQNLEPTPEQEPYNADKDTDPFTTTEFFSLPKAIGESLGDGKSNYRKWARNRRQEIEAAHGRIHNYKTENYGSDGDGTVITNADCNDNDIDLAMAIANISASPSKDNNSNNNNDANTNAPHVSMIINAYLTTFKVNELKTEETLPFEWLVDSDEDKETEAKTEREGLLSAKNNSGSRKRKSTLFRNASTPGRQGGDTTNTKIPPVETIERSIPRNASGIVGAMGRRLPMDRLVETDASLYSMLREWVKDDPERLRPHNSNHNHNATKCPAPAAAAATDNDNDNVNATATPVVVHRRKTLSEYMKMPSPRVRALTEAAAAKKAAEDAKAAAAATATAAGNPPARPQTHCVDIIGWLSCEPHQRSMSIYPCYPTKERMKELVDQKRARKKAKWKRKLRIERAQTSLRKKGIRV